jgi:hypothetical protein
VFGRSWIRISAGTPAILTEGFRGFPRALQAKVGMVLRLRPQLVSSKPISGRLPSYHLALCSPPADSAGNYPTKENTWNMTASKFFLLKGVIFWDVTPCILLEIYESFDIFVHNCTKLPPPPHTHTHTHARFITKTMESITRTCWLGPPPRRL